VLALADDSKSGKDALRDGKAYVKQVEKALRKAKDVPQDVEQRMSSLANELRHAVADGDAQLAKKRYLALKALANEHLDIVEKSAFREYAESIGLAVLFALALRGFVVEAFKIPTGSMIPTLLVGDHIFVNKFIYGIRVPFTDHYLVEFDRPERGEIVVFTFPSEEARAHLDEQPHALSNCIDRATLDDEKDFIKRIVAVEGDTVELRDNQLFINGEALDREPVGEEKSDKFMYKAVQERESNNGHHYTIQYTGKDPDFGPVKVKDGFLFAMGDNRDNSADSRCWGQVPVENVKGRAMFIWLSVGQQWRMDRIGNVIH
jgi:signal peptidase I